MGKDKDSKKQTKGKGMPLQTFQQSLAYQQRAVKQQRALMNTTKRSIDRLNEIEKDKNYISIFKRNQSNHLGNHPLDSLQDFTYSYNQKAKRDDRHYRNRQSLSTKVEYKFPLTTAQTYGWREPIDVIPVNYGLKAQMDQFITKPQKKQKK